MPGLSLWSRRQHCLVLPSLEPIFFAKAWVELAEPEATEYILRDLTPYTQYLFSIRVLNPQGVGPLSTVVVMTDEGGQSVSQSVSR